MTLSGSGPTLKDVALLAQVSIKTASRVLNNNPNVAPATRASVLSAIKQLNYVPDPAARSLRAGHDNSVGVIVDSIADIFFAELVAAVEEVLDEGGFRAFIASSNRDTNRERETVQNFIQRRCAGLIVAPAHPESLSDVRLNNVPTVFVDRQGALPQAQSVLTHDREQTKAATKHLINHGHKRIALISDYPQLETTQNRLAGYRDALAEHGIAVDEALVKDNCPNISHVVPTLTKLLAQPSPPTALISTNSRLSLGVVPVLHQLRRTDLAFISFGDFAMAEALSPAVTVVDHSPQSIGRIAGRILLEQLAKKPSETERSPIVYSPAPIIPRGSGELRPITERKVGGEGENPDNTRQNQLETLS